MINDGGPAFPTNEYHDDYDWFAGQALAGICGDGIPGSHHIPKITAMDAYSHADAMLKAREGQS